MEAIGKNVHGTRLGEAAPNELTQREKDCLVEWNHTATPYPCGKCIHHLFEEQAF